MKVSLYCPACVLPGATVSTVAEARHLADLHDDLRQLKGKRCLIHVHVKSPEEATAAEAASNPTRKNGFMVLPPRRPAPSSVRVDDRHCARAPGAKACGAWRDVRAAGASDGRQAVLAADGAALTTQRCRSCHAVASQLGYWLSATGCRLLRLWFAEDEVVHHGDVVGAAVIGAESGVAVDDAYPGDDRVGERDAEKRQAVPSEGNGKRSE